MALHRCPSWNSVCLLRHIARIFILQEFSHKVALTDCILHLTQQVPSQPKSNSFETSPFRRYIHVLPARTELQLICIEIQTDVQDNRRISVLDQSAPNQRLDPVILLSTGPLPPGGTPLTSSVTWDCSVSTEKLALCPEAMMQTRPWSSAVSPACSVPLCPGSWTAASISASDRLVLT